MVGHACSYRVVAPLNREATVLQVLNSNAPTAAKFTYRISYNFTVNKPFAWNDPQIDVLLEEATRLLPAQNATEFTALKNFFV